MFIISIRAYCYVTMSFGLKNVGAIYQRCMKRFVHVIKSSRDGDLIKDLLETFDNLWNFNIKLNPDKCTFEVPSGKLLGFIILACSIETNPIKVKAILDMGPPRILRDA